MVAMNKNIQYKIRFIIASGMILTATIAYAYSPRPIADTIPTIIPLFDPIVVEDSLFDVPNYDESRFETEILNPITRTDPQRSGGAYKVGTPATETSVSPMGAATWSMVFICPRAWVDLHLRSVWHTPASRATVMRAGG